MKSMLCDTDRCLWIRFIPWYEKYRCLLGTNETSNLEGELYQENFKAFMHEWLSRDWLSADWPGPSRRLYHIVGDPDPFQRKRNKIRDRSVELYEESKAHVSEHHQKPQTTLITSEDESSYEVVEPSTSASNQDVQSISDEMTDARDSVKSCASASGAGKHAVAQPEMEARIANLEKCKKQMEVAQQKAAADIEKAVMECKNEKECVEKNVADPARALQECKKQMEVMQEQAVANHEKALKEYKEQLELVQNNVAENIEKAIMECKKQMAADHEEALFEFKTQMKAMQKEADDSNKGNQVIDTERSAMVARIAYLEQTLKKWGEREAKLEQSPPQKNAINRQECQTQQIDQHHDQKNMDDTKHLAATAEGPTVIEFDDLFQEEYQHILAIMLERLGPAERQFFGFLQCFHRPNLNSHTLLADLRQILNSLPYYAEESRVNAFLRGMQRDVEVCKDCMPENGAADIQWYWLVQAYHVIRARFREWWELNGKEVTDAIDIITKPSLDNGIVQSAKEPNIASPTTELHQENPRQTLPEAEKLGTETLSKDNEITEAGSTDNELKQQVAQLQAIFETTREQLAQSRHEEIQLKFTELKDDGTMVKENIRSLATTQDESSTLRLALPDAKEQLEEKDVCLRKVLDEKKQLSADHAVVRVRLAGELDLKQARIKSVQNERDETSERLQKELYATKRLLRDSESEVNILNQRLRSR
ncbi:hypothetical protein DFS34DRAFT_686693 [Phlyctochytrium arcticum]|nr:hypothetical protein DFS34DRAFT_686693 [Phlyctochytrium arcticum]